MLRILIGQDKVRIQADNGLDMTVSADSVKVDFEQGVLPSLHLGSGSSEPKRLSSSNDSADIQKILMRKRQKEPSKKVSDFIAEVFRKARIPLMSREVAELITEFTDFEPKGQSAKSIPMLSSSMRSAMAREQVGEEEGGRFIKINSSYWLLDELEDEVKARGKWPSSNENPQTDLFDKD